MDQTLRFEPPVKSTPLPGVREIGGPTSGPGGHASVAAEAARARCLSPRGFRGLGRESAQWGRAAEPLGQSLRAKDSNLK